MSTTELDANTIRAAKARVFKLAAALKKQTEGKRLNRDDREIISESAESSGEQDSLSRKWACDERTIRNWRRAGAPLDDDERMRNWLAGRRQLPPGTAALLAEGTRKAYAQADTEDASGIVAGAPAALKRLEDMEIKAFRLLQMALKGGDPGQIKACRQGWLEVSESLRRYDLMIESSRRDSGELIPRSEMEAHVRHFMTFIKLSIMRMASALVPDLKAADLAGIDSLLKAAVFEQVINSLAVLSSKSCRTRLPEWFTAACTKSLDATFDDPAGVVVDRRDAFESACEELVNKTAELIKPCAPSES